MPARGLTFLGLVQMGQREVALRWRMAPIARHCGWLEACREAPP